MNLTKIEEGAIFVADAHYPHHGYDLLRLMHKINNGEIETKQLFLMGDIFDLLIGNVKRTYVPNSELIKLIVAISKKIDLFYFEGNHDFCLRDMFVDANIYNIGVQPVYMQLGNLRVGLSHGDRFETTKSYDIMTRVVRNPKTHKILSIFENLIIDKINSRLKIKEICNKVDEFEQKVANIYKNYTLADMVIEGHFHQNEVIGSYVSLPSLACDKKVGVARGEEIVFIDLKEL